MRSHHAHHVVPIATTAGVVPAPANPREASRLALARRERFRVLPGALHSSNFRVNQTSDGPSEPFSFRAGYERSVLGPERTKSNRGRGSIT
jgi:hypothetical protein